MTVHPRGGHEKIHNDLGQIRCIKPICCCTWKCLKEIVPTLVKISQYKPDIQTLCPHCNAKNETLEHLLVTCTYSSSIWLQINVNVFNIQAQHTSVTEWIISWFIPVQNINSEEINNWLITLMSTAWQIWKNKCDKIFRNKTPNRWNTISDIKWLIKQSTTDFHQDKQCLSKQSSWSPPLHAQLKINLDASFDNETNFFGIDLIARDSTVTSRGIRGRYFNGGLDLEQTECLAIKEALVWAKEMQYGSLLLESDCQNVVTSINDAIPHVHWMNRGIVNETKQHLSTRIGTTINYVRRSDNKIAHIIANRARIIGASFDILDDIPLI
ncbi:uncharacterized protein LOC113294708 [Papaver somniferum]|uniref:uncharacterized protein LOC113294708 n=1 Tax=Papaver somniferum TaxID=3469 RepID=UPI000E6F79E4|nr:uncharacterized protein LOC113294708 [Papaver somniferum]